MIIGAEAASLVRRQSYDPEDWWYYSTAAFVLKWVIVVLVIVILAGYFIGGYYHAKARMKKGIEPMGYHKWMISRNEKERFYHANPQLYNPYANTLSYQVAYGHHLNNYAPAPPVYGGEDQLPQYTPAQANKTDPDQTHQPPTYPPGVYQVGSQPQHAGPSTPARQ